MVGGAGSRSWHAAARIALTGLLLTVLPLAGVALAGRPVARNLEFPPRTQYVEHAPFSWSVFVGLALLALAMVAGLLYLLWPRQPYPGLPREGAPRRFPWWGWLAAAWLGIWWLLAWNRFPWFRPLQPYTFTPLWLGYILFIEALAWRRSGRSLLTHRPRRFLALFPLSALFWWYFEYLNRFVQNWHYVGTESFGPVGYALHATFAFSTVLPAVIGTLEWLRTHPALGAGPRLPWRIRHPRRLATATLLGACAGLAGVGVWPDLLFPLLWVAPLLLIVSLQVLDNEKTPFAPLARGDWRNVALPATAALLCGFLWEMWNYPSYTKWVYTIPFVDRFELFEMPILGYSGYLPFGLECLVIAELIGGTDAPGGHAGAPGGTWHRRDEGMWRRSTVFQASQSAVPGGFSPASTLTIPPPSSLFRKRFSARGEGARRRWGLAEGSIMGEGGAMDRSMNSGGLLIALLLSVLLAGCSSMETRVKSSVMEYLYPDTEAKVVTPSIPHLNLPLKVGIAFVPESGASQTGFSWWTTVPRRGAALSESDKLRLLEKVADHFRGCDFIGEIQVIPTTYLTPQGGFTNLDQLRTMYGIDVVALVSYDQVQFTHEGFLSITYWTLVGSYVVSGEKNETATMMDTAVYDIESRKLLFRAPGVSSVKGRATPVNLSERLRADRIEGFELAADRMVANLDARLTLFQKELEENPEKAEVKWREGYSGGGGIGGLDPLSLLLLWGIVGACRRIRGS